MTGLPLTLREPTLSRFVAGDTLLLRRPTGGMLGHVAPGDRLWLREPFRLKRKFNSLSPTAASDFAARPYFTADLARGEADERELGPARVARNLLKDWHRYHARILSVRHQSLQDITRAEVEALGYRNLNAFIGAWDRDITGFTSRRDPRTWQNNPTVLVIEVEPVFAPLPGEVALNSRPIPQVPA